jgi:hypothetical protein
LQIVRQMLMELGYATEQVSRAMDALHERPRSDGRPLLAAQELCRLLGVSRVTLWRMRLPSIAVGRRRRYDLPAVLAHLAPAGQTGQASKPAGRRPLCGKEASMKT